MDLSQPNLPLWIRATLPSRLILLLLRRQASCGLSLRALAPFTKESSAMMEARLLEHGARAAPLFPSHSDVRAPPLSSRSNPEPSEASHWSHAARPMAIRKGCGE